MIYNPSESIESIIDIEGIEPSWNTLIIGVGVIALIGAAIHAFR